MPQSLLISILILCAFIAANLPFLNQRVLTCFTWRGSKNERNPSGKPFWLRLLEWFFLYGVIGLLAHAAEASLGQTQIQGWEFYAITFCLFMVFAYPGFAYAYLWRPHRNFQD